MVADKHYLNTHQRKQHPPVDNSSRWTTFIGEHLILGHIVNINTSRMPLLFFCLFVVLFVLHKDLGHI